MSRIAAQSLKAGASEAHYTKNHHEVHEGENQEFRGNVNGSLDALP
jgi:hypothetical protein